MSGRVKAGQAIYAVADNGIGIAPEHQAKIFEIFHRLNPGAPGGEGLGLTIAQRVLERQKGKIWVESADGSGSTFHVSLPMTFERAPCAAMNNAPVILIVDDDEGHAILVRENLVAAGLNNPIQHFSDGQAVLDFFFDPEAGRSGPIPAQTYLVLLDIRMPKVDGIEVLRRLKADPELRKMPVVILTTTDDAREVERCHQLGCNVYIQKPVDYDKFAEAIRRLGLFITLMMFPPVNEH